MIDDLKIIKKYYDDTMMRLCRELFPTLLEKPGYLNDLMLRLFEPNKMLADDIIELNEKEQFKNYILGFTADKQATQIITEKTPKELLSEAGYDLYECETEEDIQKFAKYYVPGEQLCTFNGGRLKRCQVFFAVKKDVDEIKREDFRDPRRQDRYGTSVISIQFSRGEVNTLSIKNRYNSTVKNPDATFSNNLDNIVPGLTYSFSQAYNLNLTYSNTNLELENYISIDGKMYKYHTEFNEVYYCADNIIIKNEKIIRKYQKPERYIVFDYFILDLQQKTITTSHEENGNPYYIYVKEPFLKQFKHIKDIKVVKDKKTGYKTIYIKTNAPKVIEIEINRNNQMIRYKNNNIRKVPNDFLRNNHYLREVEMNNAVRIGWDFLLGNKYLETLSLANVNYIGANALYHNCSLKKALFPKNFYVGPNFMRMSKYVNLKGEMNIGIQNGFLLWLENTWPTLTVPGLINLGIKGVIKVANNFYDKKEVEFYENEKTRIVDIKKSSNIHQLVDRMISTIQVTKEKLEDEVERGPVK